MSDEREKMLDEFIDRLFTNGVGDEAYRLALTSEDGRDLGGWGRGPMKDKLRQFADECFEKSAKMCRLVHDQYQELDVSDKEASALGALACAEEVKALKFQESSEENRHEEGELRDIVWVCTKCFTASCQQGAALCGKGLQSGMIEMPVRYLRKLDLEDSKYWTKSRGP